MSTLLILRAVINSVHRMHHNAVAGSGLPLMVCVIAALLVAAVGAGDSLSATEPTTIPVCVVPQAASRPCMNADPNDPAWLHAVEIPKLTVSLGPAGKDLSAFPTKVLLMWDSNYLYIRFICLQSNLYAPFVGRNQPVYPGDVVEVFLDPKGDSREYIEWEISPRNQIFDQLITLTTDPKSDANGMLLPEIRSRDWWADRSWDCERLMTATRQIPTSGVNNAWIADIAIPADPVLRRLGLKQWQSMNVRANLIRYEWIDDAKEKGGKKLVAMNWSPIIYGCPHISPQAMGILRLEDSHSSESQ